LDDHPQAISQLCCTSKAKRSPNVLGRDRTPVQPWGEGTTIEPGLTLPAATNHLTGGCGITSR
jgi:hypothetical protein